MGAGDPLIVGVSTRALVESAVNAGWEIPSLDYFGDRDQKELVANYSLAKDFGLPLSGKGLFEAVKRLKPGSLYYVAGLDNHPQLVARLAREMTIFGNSPETLVKSKDWRFLRSICEKSKITCPKTLLPGEILNYPSGEWLTKPAYGGGGRAVRPWQGGPLQKGEVAQALVKGRPASCAVLADGSDSVVLGITEQLIGRQVFGVGMFRWCGNIHPLALPSDLNESLWEQVEEMAQILTRNLGLKGAFGLDLVITSHRQGIRAFLIEINPRPTASMELLEAQLGLNIFSLHQKASDGRLCPPEVTKPRGFVGKAVVFAGKDLVMPSTRAWKAKGRKDIPFGREKVKAQAPICTVFADAPTRDECFGELCNQAGRLRQEIADEIRY
ncbi:ATP-grasp domain-containing protein [Dethiosulfatarculus sandiegensis]|uniref:ATP-grasp domain-containing protein n=1 Tax=Dethiosulfatarculus sandiegensis TaxID=1429043 RepID=A0A0D2HP40_9BACT|nr:ATP-grasp domain-containing protein [Dethiosulfatarculus sandiegensis]KIX12303.1 hypothetical protein X474_20255 [Dethiosulfatarculus sandiegensis]